MATNTSSTGQKSLQTVSAKVDQIAELVEPYVFVAVAIAAMMAVFLI